MQLTQEQLQIIETEFRMTSVLQPNFRNYSKKLWNQYGMDVWVTYKDGEFTQADQNGWD